VPSLGTVVENFLSFVVGLFVGRDADLHFYSMKYAQDYIQGSEETVELSQDIAYRGRSPYQKIISRT
jgi:hypothetical protein